jgi:hyperosmotically inducible protein
MAGRTKLLLTIILLCFFSSGCTAAVLIPPMIGPMLIPSSAASAYQIYNINNDERDLQTIIEDEYIESRIQASIVQDKDLEVLELSPYSFNGNVYVVGTYDNKKDFSRIRHAVRNAGKVNSLTTYLFPEKENAACNMAQDMVLETKVKAALIENRTTRNVNVAVKSVQCNLILLGRVKNFRDLMAVKNVASNVKGSVSIKSFMRPTDLRKYKSRARNVATAD